LFVLEEWKRCGTTRNKGQGLALKEEQAAGLSVSPLGRRVVLKGLQGESGFLVPRNEKWMEALAGRGLIHLAEHPRCGRDLGRHVRGRILWKLGKKRALRCSKNKATN